MIDPIFILFVSNFPPSKFLLIFPGVCVLGPERGSGDSSSAGAGPTGWCSLSVRGSIFPRALGEPLFKIRKVKIVKNRWTFGGFLRKFSAECWYIWKSQLLLLNFLNKSVEILRDLERISSILKNVYNNRRNLPFSPIFGGNSEGFCKSSEFGGKLRISEVVRGPQSMN